MKNYESIAGFEHAYLEDSYVNSIRFDNETLQFELLLVLLEGHAVYHVPKKGEQHCYRKASLVFSRFSEVTWKRLRVSPIVDREGKIDFGNIDSMRFNSGTFYLEGDWGEVEVRDSKVELRIQ